MDGCRIGPVSTPSKRRKRQRGNIEQLRSGALRVRVYAGVDPLTKKDHYLVETIPAGPNAEREAEKVRTRLINQVDEQRNPRTKVTVAQLIEKYLSVANIDPGTRRGYERNLRNHVKPLLGSEQAGKVDAHILDLFYAELGRCRRHCDGKQRIDHRTAKPHECDHRCVRHECEPLAPSTVRRIHFLLSGAFSRAVRWGWITVNPASMAEPPPEPPPNPDPPTPEEAARIVNAAWEDPDWHAFVWTAMTTGARRAELCGLRWHRVDLRTGTLVVRKSIDQNGSEATEKDTKTHQHRRIALDPETVAVLTDHRARCEQRASSLGVTLAPDAFVFSLAPDGSTPMKPDTVTQRYGRLAQRLGIDTTIHKLRHYSATELIAAGVDARTVGGRLGHAGGGATTLRVYSAWVAESDQRAASTLTARMPARSTEPFDRAEYAKAEPRTAPEKIAAAIRQLILSGELAPGSPAPSQKAIAVEHHVSADTAHRAMDLLKTWGLVEASRGRRAIVTEPRQDEMPQPVREPDASAPIRPGSTPTAESGTALLQLTLVHRSEVVRTFTAEADPSDPTHLRRLLTNAARRHGGDEVDLADYELEVRANGSNELITTFAAL
ncbi:MAG: tyrosine-type recombinase/integrase [Actinophytocola sp.]|nr:tyrosine-type recombinase/integrase [Actinophytocola sp.]